MARRSITICRCVRKAGTRSRSTPFARPCKAGFRVTTNTTVFEGVDSKSVRAFFTEMMDAGVEGMMISPGYSYDKAPDQQHFTGREGNQSMFRKNPLQPRPALAIQYVPALPRVPHGKA